jgi:hypothetical protein
MRVEAEVAHKPIQEVALAVLVALAGVVMALLLLQAH